MVAKQRLCSDANTASGLEVTYDAAERVIGMMNEFNRDPRTLCEETIQNILHIAHIKF
jgi:hypothetical protein